MSAGDINSFQKIVNYREKDFITFSQVLVTVSLVSLIKHFTSAFNTWHSKLECLHRLSLKLRPQLTSFLTPRFKFTSVKKIYGQGPLAFLAVFKGTLTEGRRLSTVDLLTNVTSFVNNVNNIFNTKSSAPYLSVLGGQLY